MEGGYRREFGWALVIAMGVMLLGGSAGWVIGGEDEGWFILPGVAGLALLSWAQTWPSRQTVPVPAGSPKSG